MKLVPLKVLLYYQGNFHLCFFLTACHLHEQLFLFKNLETIHVVFTAFLVVSGKLYILLTAADSYFFPPSVLFLHLLQFEKQFKSVPPFVGSAWIEPARVRTRKNQRAESSSPLEPVPPSVRLRKYCQQAHASTYLHICVCIHMYIYFLTALNKQSGRPLSSAQSERSDFTSTHINTALIQTWAIWWPNPVHSPAYAPSV